MHYKYTLGNNHHRTADTLVKVAEHHLRRGQDEMALQLLEAASKIYASSSSSNTSSPIATLKAEAGAASAAATATYKPERARAGFRRAQALRALDRGEMADAALDECFGLYRDVYEADEVRKAGLAAAAVRSGAVPGVDAVTPDGERRRRRGKGPGAAAAVTVSKGGGLSLDGGPKRQPQDLTDDDLVELVAFWSK